MYETYTWELTQEWVLDYGIIWREHYFQQNLALAPAAGTKLSFPPLHLISTCMGTRLLAPEQLIKGLKCSSSSEETVHNDL